MSKQIQLDRICGCCLNPLGSKEEQFWWYADDICSLCTNMWCSLTHKKFLTFFVYDLNYYFQSRVLYSWYCSVVRNLDTYHNWMHSTAPQIYLLFYSFKICFTMVPNSCNNSSLDSSTAVWYYGKVWHHEPNEGTMSCSSALYTKDFLTALPRLSLSCSLFPAETIQLSEREEVADPRTAELPLYRPGPWIQTQDCLQPQPMVLNCTAALIHTSTSLLIQKDVLL